MRKITPGKACGGLTGRFGVLTPDPETPIVPETPVGTDFLQPLQVFTEFVVECVGENL